MNTAAATILVLFIVLIASFGQFLLKTVVSEVGLNFLNLFASKLFWLAIFAYLFCSIAWLAALGALPLSKAYSILSLTFIAVPLIGIIFFQEPYKVQNILGFVMIIIGVIFTQMR